MFSRWLTASIINKCSAVFIAAYLMDPIDNYCAITQNRMVAFFFFNSLLLKIRTSYGKCLCVDNDSNKSITISYRQVFFSSFFFL